VARRPSPAGRSDRSAGRRLRCAGRTHRTSDQRPCPPQLVIRRASTCRGNPCLDGNNAAGPRITRQRRAPPRRPPPGDLSRPPVHVGRSMNTLNSVGSASDATGASLTSLVAGFSRWTRATGLHDGNFGSNSSGNSGSAATSSEYRYRVPKSADRTESVVAEAEVRLKVDGLGHCGQAEEMRKFWAPGEISILLRRRRSQGE
jgi:hypothetical protein